MPVAGLTFEKIKSFATPKKTAGSLAVFGAGWVFNAKADAWFERVEFLKRLPFLSATTWSSIAIIIIGVLVKKPFISVFGAGGLARDLKDQYLSR